MHQYFLLSHWNINILFEYWFQYSYKCSFHFSALQCKNTPCLELRYGSLLFASGFRMTGQMIFVEVTKTLQPRSLLTAKLPAARSACSGLSPVQFWITSRMVDIHLFLLGVPVLSCSSYFSCPLMLLFAGTHVLFPSTSLWVPPKGVSFAAPHQVSGGHKLMPPHLALFQADLASFLSLSFYFMGSSPSSILVAPCWKDSRLLKSLFLFWEARTGCSASDVAPQLGAIPSSALLAALQHWTHEAAGH